MAEITYEKELKMSDDLKAGDEFYLGGFIVQIDKVQVNSHDDLILVLKILGAKFARRSKGMLIVPKKTPFEILKEDGWIRS